MTNLSMHTTPLQRTATRRRNLMCAPAYFDVTYAINPWMSLDSAADAALELQQWNDLRATYLELGHQVDLIAPQPGLPDMVFAANGGLVGRGELDLAVDALKDVVAAAG